MHYVLNRSLLLWLLLLIHTQLYTSNLHTLIHIGLKDNIDKYTYFQVFSNCLDWFTGEYIRLEEAQPLATVSCPSYEWVVPTEQKGNLFSQAQLSGHFDGHFSCCVIYVIGVVSYCYMAFHIIPSSFPMHVTCSDDWSHIQPHLCSHCHTNGCEHAADKMSCFPVRI